jgi:hypothetical protein
MRLCKWRHCGRDGYAGMLADSYEVKPKKEASSESGVSRVCTDIRLFLNDFGLDAFAGTSLPCNGVITKDLEINVPTKDMCGKQRESIVGIANGTTVGSVKMAEERVGEETWVCEMVGIE